MHEANSEKRKARSEDFFWLLGFLTILAFHLAWSLLDHDPPVWDMAFHQEQGWRFAQAWQAGELWTRLPELSPYYPPFYYLLEAVVLSLWPSTPLLALATNLLGLVLLSYFTFRLARLWLEPEAARIAGWLVLLFPMVVWTTRESLIDVTLSGWVALTLFLVARRRLDEPEIGGVVLGLVLAAGQLTKWTFAPLVAAPVLFAVWRSKDRRQSFRNLLTAALVATPFVFYWLLPNLNFLVTERLPYAAVENVAREAPAVASAAGLLYYPRALLGYYLFAPLAGFLVVGWLRRPQAAPLFVWVAAAGALTVLTLSFIKDPRYAMPAAVPLALLLVAPWSGRPAVLRSLLAVALFQAVLVSFPVTGPFRWGFGGQEPDPNYLNLTHEWVLASSHYYGVMGPPGRRPWPVGQLAGELEPGTRVAFAPERAKLHAGLLTLDSTRRGLGLEVYRVGLTDAWADNLRESDWLVGVTGPQGLTRLTPYNDDVYRAVEESGWPLRGEWALPDGTLLRLWRNPSRPR